MGKLWLPWKDTHWKEDTWTLLLVYLGLAKTWIRCVPFKELWNKYLYFCAKLTKYPCFHYNRFVTISHRFCFYRLYFILEKNKRTITSILLSSWTLCAALNFMIKLPFIKGLLHICLFTKPTTYLLLEFI